MNLYKSTLITKRLKLRQIEEGDVPTLVKLFFNKQTRKHLGGPIEEKKAKQQAMGYIGMKGFFCVTTQPDNKVIGLCSLDKYRTGELEVSYQFFPESWGNGYGSEAVEAIIKWGFTYMNLDHIIAVTQESNLRSRNLLESIGMKVVDKFEEYNEKQVMYYLNNSQIQNTKI